MKRLSFFASACVASSLALPVKAIENPYAFVVGASAMNVCLVRFGYLTTEEAVNILVGTTREEGITDYQLGKLMKGKNFDAHMDQTISRFGGCKAFIAKFVDRKGRSKRTIAGSELDSTIYYGVNPEKTFSKLNDLTP